MCSLLKSSDKLKRFSPAGAGIDAAEDEDVDVVGGVGEVVFGGTGDPWFCVGGWL